MLVLLGIFLLVLPRRVWDFIRSVGASGDNPVEFRGWRFDLVGPRYRFRPAVSEVASFCPSRREVFFRRVRGLVGEVGVNRGVLVHEFFLEPFRLVGRGLWGLEELLEGRRRLEERFGVVDGFYRRVFGLGVALALQVVVDGGLPVSVEPGVPGGSVGFADVVRPDLLVGLIPVEVVFGSPETLYGSRKELAVAAYGLAVEAWTGNPVDYGVVVYVRDVGGMPALDWRVVVLDDGLRRRVLRERDETAMIVDEGFDPGPSDPRVCPEWCPFRGVCFGEGVGGK